MWLTINAGPEAGKSVPVSGDRFVMGRDEHCDLVLGDAKASRNHAYLEVQPTGQVTLNDMGSTNGTFVNERRITTPTPLYGGEQVRIGDTILVLSGVAAEAPTRAEPVPAPVGYGAPTRGIDAPKLVGAADQVRAWLRSCADIGVTDIIVDLPPNVAEFAHLGPVFAAR